MALGILGKKMGMTQIFDEEGFAVPVTLIQAGPCPIIQIKTEETDGYNALQIAYDRYSRRERPARRKDARQKKRRITKPLAGHFQRAKTEPYRHLREFRIENVGEYKIGDAIEVSIFTKDEAVSVCGVSKGRGTAGVIKRHGFHGAPGGHGTHEYSRHGGSIGASANPGRVWKNTRMPGHLGNERVTTRNLHVVFVDTQKNLIAIRGAVPGARGSLVEIAKAGK